MTDGFFQFSKVVKNLIYVSLISLLIVGAFSKSEYNLLPATTLLEIVFILSSLALMRLSFNQYFFLLSASSFCYFAISFSYATIFNDTHPLDLIQAYKAFIYVSFIFVFFGKRLFEIKEFEKFFAIIIVLFFVKYTYSIIFKFTERLGDRPGILDENNFELMLLVLFLFVLAKFKSVRFNQYFIAVFALIIISGSRSALFAVLVCFVFTHFRKVDFKFFLYLMATPFLVFVAYDAFLSRMNDGANFENIDRFKLFLLFLEETSDWGVIDYLLGADRITRLSDATCLSLPYYDVLYSFSGDNSCYSVILHSYVMRVIFDHGIIGFSFLLYFCFKILTASGYDRILTFGFLSAIIASALSVSSFNSVYVALSLAIAISCFEKKHYDLR